MYNHVEHCFTKIFTLVDAIITDASKKKMGNTVQQAYLPGKIGLINQRAKMIGR